MLTTQKLNINSLAVDLMHTGSSISTGQGMLVPAFSRLLQRPGPYTSVFQSHTLQTRRSGSVVGEAEVGPSVGASVGPVVGAAEGVDGASVGDDGASVGDDVASDFATGVARAAEMAKLWY